MARGSNIVEFLSKGSRLMLPSGKTLARSRASVVAALVSVAFATAAHAQTTIPTTPVDPPAHTQHKVLPQQTGPAAPQQRAFQPPSGQQSPQAPPQRAVQSQSPSQHGSQVHANGGARGDAQGNGGRDRADYESSPFALGEALGMLGATVQPPPAYGTAYAPAYQQPYQSQPTAVPPADYDDGAPDYAAVAPQPIPPAGRDRDPESAGKSYSFGAEQFSAQDVNATVAASRIVGVNPVALMALQSRSIQAAASVSHELGAEESTAGAIDGPYAYAPQRWLSAMVRFGPSIGLGSLASQIQGPRGNLTVSNQETERRIFDMRLDPYVSSLLAAADMAANDARYRQAFGNGPTLSDLTVGHHAGPDAMLRLGQALRTSPEAPLSAVLGADQARNLVGLTGLAGVRPQSGDWTARSFLGTLDNALKNAMTRYASVKSIMLPPDYTPASAASARAEFVEQPPTFSPR